MCLHGFAHFLIKGNQTVFINSKKSYSLKITSGILQGWILGPQLFILFTNDLPLYLKREGGMPMTRQYYERKRCE